MGVTMRARKIVCTLLIVCILVGAVYAGIWGVYWLRCDKYREQLVEVYGVEHVKTDDCSIGFDMPSFGHFESGVLFREYVDLQEAGRNHTEQVVVPIVRVCFEPFGGIVFALSGSEHYATGVDEEGNYTYSFRATYFELDENLQPRNEKSAEVWERLGDSYDSVFARIDEIWDLFE